MFGKLLAKRNARRAAEAQQSPEGRVERRKGLFGLPSRKPMIPPQMMAEMAAKAQANMPAAGATPMGAAPDMGGRFGTSDRGENTKEFKRGGKVKKKPTAVKKMAKGGSASSASRRADGCATKGKTKGRFV